MFRLPRRLVDVERAASYCTGESASVRVAGDMVILEFLSQDEPEPEGAARR